MNTITLLLIAVSLSMDAFAVSVTNGACINKVKLKHCLIFGCFFGFFQFIMPIIGYFAGYSFSSYIEKYDHFIAFCLLSIVGAKMIFESYEKEEENYEKENSIFELKNIIALSFATSIDAMAIGISFVTLNQEIFSSAIIIGITTFVLSFFGVLLGKKIGTVIKSNAEKIAGFLLIGIGIKILIEHIF